MQINLATSHLNKQHVAPYFLGENNSGKSNKIIQAITPNKVTQIIADAKAIKENPDIPSKIKKYAFQSIKRVVGIGLASLGTLGTYVFSLPPATSLTEGLVQIAGLGGLAMASLFGVNQYRQHVDKNIASMQDEYLKSENPDKN